jgi:hypothetical protein
MMQQLQRLRSAGNYIFYNGLELKHLVFRVLFVFLRWVKAGNDCGLWQSKGIIPVIPIMPAYRIRISSDRKSFLLHRF